jgi:hypothetical protein
MALIEIADGEVKVGTRVFGILKDWGGPSKIVEGRLKRTWNKGYKVGSRFFSAEDAGKSIFRRRKAAEITMKLERAESGGASSVSVGQARLLGNSMYGRVGVPANIFYNARGTHYASSAFAQAMRSIQDGIIGAVNAFSAKEVGKIAPMVTDFDHWYPFQPIMTEEHVPSTFYGIDKLVSKMDDIVDEYVSEGMKFKVRTFDSFDDIKESRRKWRETRNYPTEPKYVALTGYYQYEAPYFNFYDPLKFWRSELEKFMDNEKKDETWKSSFRHDKRLAK